MADNKRLAMALRAMPGAQKKTRQKAGFHTLLQA